MKIIKTEKISTGIRLKQLITEMGISNKEFIRQLNAWLTEMQAIGKYTAEPIIREKDLSRWISESSPVHMRKNKVEMFADFFNVDTNYLLCKQVNKHKSDFKKYECNPSSICKKATWIELLKYMGYSIDDVPTVYEADECFQFIDGELLITAIESYPIDYEQHIKDSDGHTYIFDSDAFFGRVEKYIKFEISQMQPINNNSHNG